MLAAGEGIVGLQSGGGGYGDPLERDPDLVRRDVLRHWISAARARDVYGVVFAAEELDATLAVDAKATQGARSRLRAERDEKGERT